MGEQHSKQGMVRMQSADDRASSAGSGGPGTPDGKAPTPPDSTTQPQPPVRDAIRQLLVEDEMPVPQTHKGALLVMTQAHSLFRLPVASLAAECKVDTELFRAWMRDRQPAVVGRAVLEYLQTLEHRVDSHWPTVPSVRGGFPPFLGSLGCHPAFVA